MLSAQQLATLLIQQVTATGRISLSEASVPIAGLDDLVKSDLRRKGPLLLGAKVADILANPPSTGFSVTTVVPSGDDGFLGLAGRTAMLQFLVTATSIDLVLTVSTRKTPGGNAPWVFSTSFPETAYLPYDELSLENPQLVLSTGASSTPPKGLNFDGTLDLTGIFKAAADLVGASPSYPLAGAIDGSGDTFAFALEADFHMTGKSLLDIITLESVGVGVALSSVKHDKQVDRLVPLFPRAT